MESGVTDNVLPLLQPKNYAAPSLFEPTNLLREARRQRGWPSPTCRWSPCWTRDRERRASVAAEYHSNCNDGNGNTNGYYDNGSWVTSSTVSSATGPATAPTGTRPLATATETARSLGLGLWSTSSSSVGIDRGKRGLVCPPPRLDRRRRGGRAGRPPRSPGRWMWRRPSPAATPSPATGTTPRRSAGWPASTSRSSAARDGCR